MRRSGVRQTACVVFVAIELVIGRLSAADSAKYVLVPSPRESSGTQINMQLLVDCDEPRYVLTTGLADRPNLWVNVLCAGESTTAPMRFVHVRAVPIDVALTPVLANYDQLLVFKVELRAFNSALAFIKANGPITCELAVPLLRYDPTRKLFVGAEMVRSNPIIVEMANGNIVVVRAASLLPGTVSPGGLRSKYRLKRSRHSLIDSSCIDCGWVTQRLQAEGMVGVAAHFTNSTSSVTNK
jgi:hypothetical protein